MALGINETIRTTRSQAIANALDGGASAGKIEFYDGVQPTTGAAITSQTLLATLLLSDPSAVVATGVLTLNSVNDDVAADADGTITWARATDSDDLHVFDVDCGVAASGAGIIFNTTTVRLGGVVQILSGTITEGNI